VVLECFLPVGEAFLWEQHPQGGAFSPRERGSSFALQSSRWLLACCLAEMGSSDTEVRVSSSP